MSSCGLVGLPNVGKSTIFNLLTDSDKAKVGNYMFCTINPNVSEISFYDSRLKHLSDHFDSKITRYTSMKFIDIAGLISGASNGEGHGNAFLSHIDMVDCIIHVVRCFSDNTVDMPYDSIDPIRDIKVIQNELLQRDLKYLKNIYESKVFKKHKEYIQQLLIDLKNGKKVTNNNKEIRLLTTKPQVLLCNGNLSKDRVFIEKVQKYAEKNHIPCVQFDADDLLDKNIQAQLDRMESEQEKGCSIGFIEPNINLQSLIKSCRKAINLVSFFTAGKKESRAYDIKYGTNVRNASGKIHSDFIKKFIRAQVRTWNNLDVMHTEKEHYIVEDGDVILYL